MFKNNPLIIQSPTLNETIFSVGTFNLLKIAVSTIIEWEKANITANIVICFTLKVNEAIAPKAAYKFKVLPRTKTIAASPGNPNRNINGLKIIEIQPIIGVNLINVIIRYTGTKTRDRIHNVFNPLTKPLFNVSKVIKTTPTLLLFELNHIKQNVY